MVTILISVILFVLIIAGAVVMVMSKSGKTRVIARNVAAAFSGLQLGLIIGGSVVVIGATEVGVPISFGRLGDPMRSGVHLKAIWTKVEKFPVRPLSAPDVEITARTSQAGQVKAVVGARWHIAPEGAREAYLQVRTGDEDRITKEVVDKALGQAVGNVFVKLDNGAATTDRTAIESGIKTELTRLAQPFGVSIDNVFVRSVEPDAKTADALARVAAQQRETEIAKESQQTATEQNKARLIDATGARSAAAQLPSGLTQAQVDALCLQVWERTAAKAIAAGQPLYTSPCGASSAVIPSAGAK